jgi:hypothetical protein
MGAKKTGPRLFFGQTQKIPGATFTKCVAIFYHLLSPLSNAAGKIQVCFKKNCALPKTGQKMFPLSIW